MFIDRTICKLCIVIGTFACGVALAQAVSVAATRPVGPPDEAILLAAAGQPMRIGRTDHFLIASDAPASLVDGLTARLEQTHRAVVALFSHIDLDIRPPASALEVIFFDQSDDYASYARALGVDPDNTFGFYDRPTRRSAFLNVLNHPDVVRLSADIRASRENLDRISAALRDLPDADTRLTIELSDGRTTQLTRAEAERLVREVGRQLERLDRKREAYLARIHQAVFAHETAHQVLDRAGVYPADWDAHRWIVEGLACLLESMEADAETVPVPPNALRRADFCKAVAEPADPAQIRPSQLAQAIAAGRVVSPARLLTEPRLLDPQAPAAAGNYATAWALTFFLARTQPARLGEYLEELRACRQVPTVQERTAVRLFETFFGPVDEAFVQRWGEFIFQ